MTFNQLFQIIDCLKDGVFDLETIRNQAVMHDKIPKKLVQQIEDILYGIEQVVTINTDGDK